MEAEKTHGSKKQLEEEAAHYSPAQINKENPQNHGHSETSALTRTFSEDELLNVFTYAETLRQADSIKKDSRVAEAIQDKSEGSRISLESALDVAKNVGMPVEYLKRAVDMLYPSPEMQVTDINRFEALPTADVVIKSCNQILVDKLRESLPNIRVKRDRWFNGFFWEDNDIYFIRTEQPRQSKIAQLFNLKNYKMLATLEYNCDYQEIKILAMDPIFLRQCGETIEKLKKMFSNKISDFRIDYDYSPHNK